MYQIIDHSEEIENILAQNNECENDTVRLLANLWKIELNENGKPAEETEILIDKNGIKAKLLFIRTTNNYWLIGIEAETEWSGCSCGPSVWNRIAYADYHTAKREGIRRIKDFFRRNVSAKQMETIKSALAPHENMQLDLF